MSVDEGQVQFDPNLELYEHAPLAPGMIRVVSIQAGAPDEQICLDIKEVLLDESEDNFTALSYTWAPRAPIRQIRIGNKFTFVTANLYAALLALRQKHAVAPLWIDQITINQMDVAEKNTQVAMMGAIYSRAASVLIWLSSDIYEEKSYIKNILQFDRSLWFTRTTFHDDSNGELQASLAANELGGLHPEVWNSIGVVFQSDYFERVWIIQETVLAKRADVMISGETCAWEVFMVIGSFLNTALSRIRVKGSPDVSAIRRAHTGSIMKMSMLRNRLHATDGVWMTQPKWTLLDLIRYSWRFKATDRRDIIYAVLGLLEFSDHCLPSRLKPDYSPDLKFSAVLEAAWIESLLESSSRLNVLTYCVPPVPKNIPSWMAAACVNFLNPYQCSRFDEWNAGGHHPHVQRVAENDLALSFTVTLIGQVSSMACQFPGGESIYDKFETSHHLEPITMSQEDLFAYVTECADLARQHRSETGDRFDLEFARAFFLDLSLDFKFLGTDLTRYNAKLQRETEEVDIVAELMNTGSEKIPQEENLIRRLIVDGSPDKPVWKKHFDHIMVVIKLLMDWRFGCVNPSYADSRCGSCSPSDEKEPQDVQAPLLAWLPVEIKEGDIVCVIHGFRFPMVIRPAADNQEQYRFMGMCYVHTFMDGEALTNNNLVTKDLVFV